MMPGGIATVQKLIGLIDKGSRHSQHVHPAIAAPRSMASSIVGAGSLQADAIQRRPRGATAEHVTAIHNQREPSQTRDRAAMYGTQRFPKSALDALFLTGGILYVENQSNVVQRRFAMRVRPPQLDVRQA